MPLEEAVHTAREGWSGVKRRLRGSQFTRWEHLSMKGADGFCTPANRSKRRHLREPVVRR